MVELALAREGARYKCASAVLWRPDKPTESGAMNCCVFHRSPPVCLFVETLNVAAMLHIGKWRVASTQRLASAGEQSGLGPSRSQWPEHLI